MIKPNEHIVIGLSGGADSVCLAHLLLNLREKYGLRLTAVHINHNLRETADNDQHFVEQFCCRNNLELKVFSIDIKAFAQQNSLTLEEAGRQQRYLAFNKLSPDKIAVAHNMNDNAETMLMRLCRGTGLKGMGGILPVRDNIIRPLIMITRQEIEEYCRQNGLDYCIDETNLETDYTRNKIRHCILPQLKEINPNIISVLAKNARLFRQENEFIENLALNEYNACKMDNALDVNRLKMLEKPLLYRVLRYACEETVGLKDISLEHIEIIENLIYNKSGKSVTLPKGLVIYREYDHLVFAKETQETDYELQLDVPIKTNGKCYMLSQKKGLEYPSVGIFAENGVWHLRTRQNGDVFVRGDGRFIKLKQVFIDKKIPVSKRNSALLLANQNRIYWADCLENKFKSANYYFYLWEEKDEQ